MGKGISRALPGVSDEQVTSFVVVPHLGSFDFNRALPSGVVSMGGQVKVQRTFGKNGIDSAKRAIL